MFYQHYLEYKKPTFLACNPEEVYATILEFSKNNSLFQNRQTYSHRILEIFQNFLNMVSVRLLIKGVRTSQGKQRWKAPVKLQRLDSWKEIVSNNTKEHIKRVICRATVFLLFWLYLDSQSSKIVRNSYLPHPLDALLF